MKNNQKGITLIALIITIIVMLILVGVSVNIALNNGLFKATQNAATQTKEAVKQENALSSGQVTVGDVTYSSIDDYLEGLNGYEYEITIGGVRTGILFNGNWTWKKLAEKNSNVNISNQESEYWWMREISINYNGKNNRLAYLTPSEYYGGSMPDVLTPLQDREEFSTILKCFDWCTSEGHTGLYLNDEGTLIVSYISINE